MRFHYGPRVGACMPSGSVPVMAVFFTVFLISAHVRIVQCMITPYESACELEALNVGTRMVDRYNEFDEETEWDMRVNHDFLSEHLGFAGWIQAGLWKSDSKTAHRGNARVNQQRGGWTGSHNISSSAYWAFDNKWLYMMGDSTQRQVSSVRRVMCF